MSMKLFTPIYADLLLNLNLFFSGLFHTSFHHLSTKIEHMRLVWLGLELKSELSGIVDDIDDEVDVGIDDVDDDISDARG